MIFALKMFSFKRLTRNTSSINDIQTNVFIHILNLRGVDWITCKQFDNSIPANGFVIEW